MRLPRLRRPARGASFDAVVCTWAFALLVVIGTRPFGLDEPASIAGTALAVGLVAGLAIVCFAKGRVLLGTVGLFVPVVAADYVGPSEVP